MLMPWSQASTLQQGTARFRVLSCCRRNAWHSCRQQLSRSGTWSHRRSSLLIRCSAVHVINQALIVWLHIIGQAEDSI